MEPLRIGFFLDGYTLRKVNEYYRVHHRFHSRLDFRGLKSWVQMQEMCISTKQKLHLERDKLSILKASSTRTCR